MEDKIFELRKLIRELEKFRGRHTELISVYVPAGYNLVEIANQLMQEKSTAMNIKSKTTRKNVLAALEKIIQHLKLFKEIPPNGLVIFCGNVSPVEGKEEIKLWSFEPPEKMNVKVYWCDQVFVLDPLKDLIREREIFGLIVLDAREATIGLLKGKSIIPLKHFESTVPSKTIKGGMCISEDSLVQLRDGKIIKIKDLKIKDKILAFSFKDFQPIFTSCKAIFKRRASEAYEIITNRNMKLIASPNHRLFIVNGKIKEIFVEELKPKDKLLAIDGTSIKQISKDRFSKILKTNPIQVSVKEKRKIKTNGFFYDLYIPKYNSFFVNGILVHNSQARYDRLREDAINEFLTKVGEKASELFLEQKDLKGVIIGGPGPIKEKFAREKYLNYQIQKKLLGVKDVSYTDEYGLKELVNRSQDLLEKTALAKERALLEKFFSELGKGGNVVYGLNETTNALEKGALETLLLSEDFDFVRVSFKCQNQHRSEKILPKDMIKKQRCEVCKNPLAAETIKNLGDELSEKAKEFGIGVEFISSSTDEGKEFRKIGGIGGFLRFKVS